MFTPSMPFMPSILLALFTGAAVEVDAGALGGDDACERVGDDFGPGFVRDGQPHRQHLTGEGLAVSVAQALGADLAYEGCGGGTVEADVEESGPGDLDATDAGGGTDLLAQDFGDVAGVRPAGLASCSAMFVA